MPLKEFCVRAVLPRRRLRRRAHVLERLTHTHMHTA